MSSITLEQNEIVKMIREISQNLNSHIPQSDTYKAQEAHLREMVQKCLGEKTLDQAVQGSFYLDADTVINWPFQRMGSVTTADLVRLDEIIIFNYYARMRGHYKLALDLGANLGLHTLVLAKLGYHVRAFEPDPLHFVALTKNIKLNQCENVSTNKLAISDKHGSQIFLRVEGNTTSSHLLGAKDAPYGELTEFEVECVAAVDIIEPSVRTIAKIDIEGQESVVITSLAATQWNNLDAFVEVGTGKNAKAIYEYCALNSINIFAQQIAWHRVRSIEEMPTSYHGGSIFISSAEEMNW